MIIVEYVFVLKQSILSRETNFFAAIAKIKGFAWGKRGVRKKQFANKGKESIENIKKERHIFGDLQ